MRMHWNQNNELSTIYWNDWFPGKENPNLKLGFLFPFYYPVKKRVRGSSREKVCTLKFNLKQKKKALLMRPFGSAMLGQTTPT